MDIKPIQLDLLHNVGNMLDDQKEQYEHEVFRYQGERRAVERVQGLVESLQKSALLEKDGDKLTDEAKEHVDRYLGRLATLLVGERAKAQEMLVMSSGGVSASDRAVQLIAAEHKRLSEIMPREHPETLRQQRGEQAPPAPVPAPPPSTRTLPDAPVDSGRPKSTRGREPAE